MTKYIVKKKFLGGPEAGTVLEKIQIRHRIDFLTDKVSDVNPIEMQFLLDSGYIAEEEGKWGPEFMECDTCRAKPGSPILCSGCLHNRDAIKKLLESLR